MKDYEYQDKKWELEGDQAKLKTLSTTNALVAAGLFILIGIGLYGLPLLIERKQWFIIIVLGFVGYVLYRCFEVLQEYEGILKNRINTNQILTKGHEAKNSTVTKHNQR